MMDLVYLGLRSLKRERIRSLLTIIGIVIGVATVFALISISQGTNRFIEEQFSKFGADKIIILPGGTETSLAMALVGKPFTERAIEAIKQIPGIELVAGVGYRSMEVEYRGKKVVMMVTGAPTDNFRRLFEDVQGYELQEGRYIRKNSYEAIVGYLTANKVFRKKITVGSFIYINGRKFKVVGIMKEVGNRVDDTAIIIPMSAFEEITGEKGKYDMIFAKVVSPENIDSIVDRIKRKLKAIRGSEDFSVLTSKQMLERIMTIMGGISIVLIIIAAVSLIVGAIGVMNTMYMSVTERTREIGILKAVGATKSQILTLFLSEAAALGLIGGAIGVGIGAGVAIAAESISHSAGITVFKVYLGPELFLGSLLFSIIIGVLAGFLPAKRAADLDPVEALRYE